MPRPGPRPYECVRRAWHSDRHQPIRGSLIQEIFRVVNETHSSQIKKNKEWQEKLPVVVLKAEEIMYSKANSEAEYMDFQTIWERANDAINTIIRREESTETGDLLQPCIEAALILGCTARRASRSQRNSNPRSYLSPSTQEPANVLLPNNVTHGGSSRSTPLPSGKPASTPRIAPYYATTTRPITMNSTQLRLPSSPPLAQVNNPTMPHVYSLSSENQTLLMDIHQSADMGRVYPLYYSTQHQIPEIQPVIQCPHARNLDSAVLGASEVPSMRKPAEKGSAPNFFICDGIVNVSSRNLEAESKRTVENEPEIGCDLSLRLSPLSVPGTSTQLRCAYEVDGNEPSSSEEGSKSCDLSPRIRKEFCFFPRENANDPLEPSSSKHTSKGKGVDLDGPNKRQKESVTNLVENRNAFRPDLFFGRVNNSDR
ncbi:hypothetical protein ACHQM5_002554 [Ranunculus cassubicifolius]